MHTDVVALPGSLRAGSYTHALLRAAAQLVPEGMAFETLDIRDLPLYDADHDESYGGTSTPAAAEALRERVSVADGLVLGVTEYNWGPSAPLKNAIDWLSRPLAAGPLSHKPVGLVGASPGPAGTGRAQLQMRQNLAYTRTFVLPFPLVHVGNAGDVFGEDLELEDGGVREQLSAFMLAFSRWIVAVGGLELESPAARSR
ncbi:MAG TPA: NAD(P)H-dependent oxidoreductase [Baekduia sp.]|nr:NAD(P)H-dependent oxidoreductase [Baekduia sp.]